VSDADAGRLMDRIYARQRHIYDASRKYYLLGRDTLIAELAPPPAARVLEIGCGTGRNLIQIALTYPESRCCGVDISSAMLATAGAASHAPGSSRGSRWRRATPHRSIRSNFSGFLISTASSSRMRCR